MSAKVAAFQRAWNGFEGHFNLHYRDLRVDGKPGEKTETAVKKARYFLGVGHSDWRRNSTEITDELLLTLKNPFRQIKGFTRRENRKRRRVASSRRKARIKRWKAQQGRGAVQVPSRALGPPHWGGSIYIVMATRPIAKRLGHPITSTKRFPPIGGNNSSWHNTFILDAFADDYGTFNGGHHVQEIRAFWGNHNEASGTFEIYFVEADGAIYAKQTLWAVVGHHDHAHDGAKA